MDWRRPDTSPQRAAVEQLGEWRAATLGIRRTAAGIGPRLQPFLKTHRGEDIGTIGTQIGMEWGGDGEGRGGKVCGALGRRTRTCSAANGGARVHSHQRGPGLVAVTGGRRWLDRVARAAVHPAMQVPQSRLSAALKPSGGLPADSLGKARSKR